VQAVKLGFSDTVAAAVGNYTLIVDGASCMLDDVHLVSVLI